MQRERFISFLENNILSLFTGSEIVGEEESTPRDACVAQGANGTLLVKFQRSDPVRFVVKRVQPFKSFEVSLVRSIVEEMRVIFRANLNEEFVRGLESQVTQRAICRALSKSASSTLDSLLTSISNWGLRTYEGQKAKFGFIITSKKSTKANPNMNVEHILKKDFSALLSDGINTYILLSADGQLLSYQSLSKSTKQNIFAPYEYINIASLCTGSRVGVCLDTEGEVLVFKDRQLLFAKRNGNWISFSHEEIVAKLAERSGEVEEVRRAVYLSALDTSFARDGGCIVHLNSTAKTAVLKHIDSADLLSKESYDYKQGESNQQSFLDEQENEQPNLPFEEFLKEDKCTKSATLMKIIGDRKFQELDRKLREELIGIDGATIIDYEGNVIAVGAIIKIEAGSVGGGRLAAAKTLSNYGIAMKISADGCIEGFRFDRAKGKAKPLFVIG